MITFLSKCWIKVGTTRVFYSPGGLNRHERVAIS